MLGEQTEPRRGAGGDEPPSPPSDAPAVSRWRTVATDAAVLCGLAGVAVTQPLLGLLGENPTFFVAGRYGTGAVVALALVVALVPWVVALAASAPWRLVGGRAGAVAHGVVVAALAGAFGLVVLRTLRIDHAMAAIGAAVVAGGTVALAEIRWPPVRRFLTYLAAGNVVFVLVFLVASPTADVLGADATPDVGPVEMPELTGPVLVVVLDELPLSVLLRPDGTINDTRFPNFARLARLSTWYPDAASESIMTFESVPTILTGARTDMDDPPTAAAHPRNYFTLFGDRFPINQYEPVTDLCPAELCPLDQANSLGQLLSDASVVYRHRVLPADLRSGLPAIDQSWGRFGDDIGVHASRTDSGGLNPFGQLGDIDLRSLSPVAQAAAVVEQAQLIGPAPSVNLIHVLLPHMPYVLTPWGVSTDTWGGEEVPDRPLPGQEAIYRDVVAQQTLQVGVTDAAIGAMIDRMQSRGAWDDALVIVTADHGIDAVPPGFGRDLVDDGSAQENLRVPLFVKAPGQTDGAIDWRPASTIDVLPTIVDLLDIETDWSFEGHSLVDGSRPTVERRLRTDPGVLLDVVAERAAMFPAGDDWDALAAVGPAEGLLGAEVAGLVVGGPSPLRWTLDRRDLLDDLAPAEEAPYLLRATVTGADRPVELLVAVNGRVAGTVAAYPAGDAWRASGVMAPYFEEGANEVVAYEVAGGAGGITLHPVAEG